MGTSESEMEREKEREKVNTEIDDSDESQEELDEKGEEKVMIPVEKLTIPEELCKMKSTGRGRGTKKFLVFFKGEPRPIGCPQITKIFENIFFA